MGNIDILTIVFFPVHEHGCLFISFCHLQFRSLVFYVLFRVQVFTSLVRFIPRQLIVFNAIVSGLIPWLIFLLFHYGCIDAQQISALWYWILWPYWICVSGLSSNFLIETFGFSLQNIMSTSISESYTSPLPMWMTFISFSCLIVVVMSSSTMLNNSS